MILLQPEQGIVDQETLHLGAAKIVDGRVPVWMKPLARVRVLVKRGAIKICQAKRVRREMRRNPINDNSNARRMGRIHKTCKSLRVAKARGRCIEAGRLIAPRRVIGVFGDGQQLDMGEPQVTHIVHKIACQFIIAQKPGAIFFAPGSQMHFVNGHGRTPRIARGARLEIVAIRPLEMFYARNHRCRMRPQLRRKSIRVSLEGQADAISAYDLKLVFHIFIKAGKEYLPHPRAHALAHHMPAAIPVVEVADDRDALRIGRPHGKMHPRGALMRNDMGAHLVVEPQMRALRHVIIV